MLLHKVSIQEKVSVLELRTLTGLSQKDFAESVGIPSSTFIKKERGESPFLASEINRMSVKYGVPMEQIAV